MEYIIIGHLTLLTLSIHSYLHNCHLNVNHNTDNKFVFILIYMRINVYFLSFLDTYTYLYLVLILPVISNILERVFLPRNTIKVAITKTHKMGQFYFQTKFYKLHFCSSFSKHLCKGVKTYE